MILTAIVAALVIADQRSATADDVAPEERAFSEKVQPFLTRYCVSCHGAEKPKAGVNLAKYQSIKAIEADRKTWEKVIENVGAGIMPPEDKPQPPEAEAEFLTEWVEARLSKVLCDGPARPGLVTIRRLNRAEYDNTIRDLVGVDVHASTDFPTDDVGYGFDNNGDVLTVSPLLLEKYLTAAELITDRAIVTDRTDYGESRIFRGTDMRRAGGDRYDDGRILASNGAIRLEHRFPRDGDYLIKVRAFGHQAGDEPVKMAIRLDDEVLTTHAVTATESAPRTYEAKLRLPDGDHRLAVSFVNDFYDEKAPEGKRDRNLIVLAVEVQGPIVPNGRALPESHARLLRQQPRGTDAASWRAAARACLKPFVNRAFRRPASNQEIDRLLRIVEAARSDGSAFPEAIQLAIQAVLVSPNFLFRVELDRGVGPSVPLNDYELASRLSYFLWSTMPDDALFKLAAEGRLHEPATLVEQARRMLQDPKAEALVDNFGMQWLTLRGLDAIAPDRRVFRDWDDGMKADLIGETKAFLSYIIREDRPILDVLDSDYTFLNERLAKHYGIDDVEGNEFRKVPLKGDQRGGALTHASVLTVTSNPTRTSPVKRGKWVLEQILGDPPPAPPPNVPELNESQEAVRAASLRERLEQHRRDPNCAVCHNRLDPLGFVFENYDAVGAWRERDGSFDIDPSGSLPSGESFRGPKEFKRYLLDRKDDFTRALAAKLLTYALGRGLETEDDCEVDRIAARAKDQDYRFSALITEIVLSVPFRMREGREGTP